MKKLLLLLLFLPMIGFGQNEGLDTIVFSDGKKVTVIVIEVGVYEVKYKFKNENNTNIIQTNTLAQIIFSSGRTQTFKGNDKLNFKEERRRRLGKKKKKRIKEKENFKSSFEVGAVFGLISSIVNGEYLNKLVESDNRISVNYIQRTNGGLMLQYNISDLLSINSKFLYQVKGFSLITENRLYVNPNYDPIRETIYNFHYISLPLLIKLNFGNKLRGVINAGLYTSYLLKEIENTGKTPTPLNEVNRIDFGFIFGGGLSYMINKKVHLWFDAYTELGTTNNEYSYSKLIGGYNVSYNLLLGCSYNLSKN